MGRNVRIVTREDMRAIGDEPLESRYSEQSTYEVFVNAARDHRDSPAVTFQLKGGPGEKQHSWTYAAYLDRITRAANLFRSLGADETNSVALLLPNIPETLAAMFGAQAASIVNPINPLLEPEQIAAILRDSDAKILVTLKPFPKTDVAQRAAAAVAKAPNVKTVIEVDLRGYLSPPLSWIVPLIRPKSQGYGAARVLGWESALAGQPGDRLTFDLPAGGQERVAAYFHTGGTTGDPKLATHKVGGMLFIAWAARHCVYSPGDTVLCALPLFHVFGAYVMALACPANGGHLVLLTPAGFRGEGVIDNFWKLVERYRANFFVSVPTALSALDQRPVDADVSSLTYSICGSAPLPPELFRRFEEKTGIRILEGYGQTEATVVCSANPPDGERKIGSVGFPLPYTEMAILHSDDDGAFVKRCATDEIGEICIRGPHVFPGYKQEENNAKLFVDDPEGRRWLRSGDLGREDADGYFWITGRAKDLIIRGGHNIDPGVIEDALAAHPAVAFTGAIGQPDAYAGELPCVYVELKEGASATPEELVRFAAEHVPERAARPVYAEVMEELPKTAVGKVFKPDLRRRAIERVLSAALEKDGLDCGLTVEKDEKHGLVAVLRPGAEVDEAALRKTLGGFSTPWRIGG